MKRYKHLLVYINRAVKKSLSNGQVNEKSILDAIEVFNKLSIGERLFALKEYLKRMKREINNKTLIIESPVNLSDEQIKGVKSKFIDSKHEVLDTKFKLDSSLLGGLRFRIGDVVYDDTIRLKINQIGGVIRG